MKVVLTHTLSQAGMEFLEKHDAEIFVANSNEPSAYLDQLQNADAFIIRIGRCDAHIIDSCPNLRVIGRTGVGYDNVDVAYAAKLGIPTVFTPGANYRSVAEHTVAMMFALSKNLIASDYALKAGHWELRDAKKSFELFDKKVGIIGVGAIGQIVAEICQAIGMKTAGFSHSGNRQKVEAAGCEYYADMHQLLRECDIITIHTPLTPETRNMISAPDMRAMKKNALLINTSRGAIVNEADLTAALNRGIIAGAGIDVFDQEPARTVNPLLGAKNLIATPHMAALSREALDRMSVQCAKGCIAVLQGEHWPDVVDKSAYSH